MYRHKLYNDKTYIRLIQDYSKVFLDIVGSNDLSILVVGESAQAVLPQYHGGFHPSAVLGNYNNINRSSDDRIQASNDAYNQFYQGITGNTDLITPFTRYVMLCMYTFVLSVTCCEIVSVIV